MTLPPELQAARLLLAKERPYLASASWALQPVPKPGLGTLAVDMYWRIYYDPDILARWPVEVIEGVLYHEICHLLRNHAERMKDFHPRLSNIAVDAEINDDLVREGVKFPTPPLTPELIGQPENLLAEEYYAALERLEQQPSAGETQDQGHTLSASPDENKTGKSFQAKDGFPNSQDGDSKNSQSIQGGDGNGSDSLPSPGSGQCGSCATGQIAPWEDGPPSKESSAGLSQTEGELIRRDVAKQIREHANGQGSLPGHLVRWAEEKLNPKVDWRKKLAAVIRYAVADTNGATDYSYRRPSRRHSQVGKGDVIFPSMRCPLPSVAVVADTSASISENMLAQTLAEISGIFKSLGHREGIHVLAVDRTVQFCRLVFRPEQIQLTGGGGTDMRAGLDAAARLQPLPQLVIVITDGHTPWPEHPPKGMKVIVVLSGDGPVPNWANVIHSKSGDGS